MKKIYLIIAPILFALTLIISCKKNTLELFVTEEKESNSLLSTVNLKSWLSQSGGIFKKGNISISENKVSSKGNNNNTTGQWNWELAVSYTFKGLEYKSIPYTFSNNQRDTLGNNIKFSLVFRKNKDSIEAKFKTSTRAIDVADPSKSYLQESYYDLNGLLSEVWIYINNKPFKINKKKIYHTYNASKGIANRTCNTFTWQGFSSVMQNPDGSCYVIKTTNYFTYCYEEGDQEQYDESIEHDFGGCSSECGTVTEIIPTDCFGVPGGTAQPEDCITLEEAAFDNAIKDSLTNDCLKKILDSIKNLKEGKIAEIIYKFSGEIPKWNWSVKEGTISGPANAITNFPPVNGTITSIFDFNKLKGSTSLAVARTFMHEAVHAYLLNYYYNEPVAFNLEYPEQLKWFYKTKNPDLNANQHNLMIKRFVEDIGLALKQFGEQSGISIDSQIYMDIAWGGLDFLNNTSLTDDDKERINNRIAAEKMNSFFIDTYPSGYKLLCN